jgi:hypothetical protein
MGADFSTGMLAHARESQIASMAATMASALTETQRASQNESPAPC